MNRLIANNLSKVINKVGFVHLLIRNSLKAMPQLFWGNPNNTPNSIIFFRATSGSKSNPSEIPKDGLVRDGTPCGENLVRKTSYFRIVCERLQRLWSLKLVLYLLVYVNYQALNLKRDHICSSSQLHFLLIILFKIVILM